MNLPCLLWLAMLRLTRKDLACCVRHPSSGEVSCIIEAVADVLTCAFSSVSSATCKLSLNVQPIKKQTHTHAWDFGRSKRQAKTRGEAG